MRPLAVLTPLALLALWWLAFNLWAVRDGRPTVSEHFWYWADHYPVVPYLIGLACGLLGAHFFWRR